MVVSMLLPILTISQLRLASRSQSHGQVFADAKASRLTPVCLDSMVGFGVNGLLGFRV